MLFRNATPADADTIAHFHALSWRSAYRGILCDDFLDHKVVSNRLHRWRSRMLPQTPDNMLIRLACEGVHLKGFVCVQLDHDPQWGALIDNLHVHPESKGQGIGRQLMAAAAEWVRRKRPLSNLHLYALEANHPARTFYHRLGGQPSERILREAPDGSDLPEVRYSWSPPFQSLL